MDKVLQAFVIDRDKNCSVLYQEKVLRLDGVTIIGAIYKSNTKYYCAITYVENLVYTFDIINKYAGYVEEADILKSNILELAVKETSHFIQARLEILRKISSDTKLPSVLNVAFDGEFIIYYRIKGGALRVAQSSKGKISISLPPAEQIRLADTLGFLNIKVEREYGYNTDGRLISYGH